MSRLTDRRIESLLREEPVPEPPPELLERLRNDLPDTLPVSDGPSKDRRFPRRIHLAAAASLVAAIGGGFLGLRVLREPPPEATPHVVAERQVPASRAELPTMDSIGTIDQGRELSEAETLPASSPPVTQTIDPPEAAEPQERAKRSQPRAQDETREMLRYLSRDSDAEPQETDMIFENPKPAREEQILVTSETPRLDEGKVESTVSLGQAGGRTGSIQQQSAARPSRDKKGSTQVLRKLDSYGVGPEPVRAPAPSPPPPSSQNPNDAPYDDVYFRDYGERPFIDTEDDRLSTFGLDVDTGSYTVVRRYLDDGHLPPREAVRIEEMINYFDYGDEPPGRGDFALHAEGSPSLFGASEKYHLLRFHVHGREIAESRRPAADLTFVIDVSGSMEREDRLELVKRALHLLLDQLRSDDRVALVVYGSRGQVLLEPTSEHERIRYAIDHLHPGGSTNAEEGLRLAYEIAARYRRPASLSRILLCSDGVANVGRTGPESILEQVRRAADEGIELSTVGFGMGNYNDVLMEQLADRGDGRYHYVDDLDEAHRVFVEGLTGTLMTIAAEAKAQVEFDPEIVERYRLIGYENRNIADRDFRNDAVDAGEIGAGHGVTALYELKLRRSPRRRDAVATLRLRYHSVAQNEVVEEERVVTGRDFAASWEKASPALQLTSLVAELGEILKGSWWAEDGDLEEVFRRTQRVSSAYAGEHEVADLVSLIGRAARLRERSSR